MAEKTQDQHNELATEVRDLQHVMGTPQGRRFVWRLLDRCHIYTSSFTGNSETYFREGERNIGLMLFADINTSCPGLYATMQKEHIELLKRKQQRKELKRREK